MTDFKKKAHDYFKELTPAGMRAIRRKIEDNMRREAAEESEKYKEHLFAACHIFGVSPGTIKQRESYFKKPRSGDRKKSPVK